MIKVRSKASRVKVDRQSARELRRRRREGKHSVNCNCEFEKTERVHAFFSLLHNTQRAQGVIRMISKREREKFIHGIDYLTNKIKVDTYDLSYPIPAMPEEFKEFHGESGYRLLLLREQLLTASKVFLTDVMEMRERLIKETDISEKDITVMQEEINASHERQEFLDRMKEMNEALSFLDSYKEANDKVIDEYLRSKRADA